MLLELKVFKSASISFWFKCMTPVSGIDFDEFLRMYRRLFVLCKSVVSHDVSDILVPSPRRNASFSPSRIPAPLRKVTYFRFSYFAAKRSKGIPHESSMKTHCGTFTAWLPQISTRLTLPVSSRIRFLPVQAPELRPHSSVITLCGFSAYLILLLLRVTMTQMYRSY